MNWNIRPDRSKDRAVSPVIGVILMVAITVILAAVVGGTVMSTGSETSTTPQASLTFDYPSASSDIVITHNGGQALAEGNLKVMRGGSEATSGVTFNTGGDSKLSAGETISVAYGGTQWNSGDTVKLVWSGQNGDSSILATFEVP